MFLIYADNAHREVNAALQQHATHVINRTTMSMTKTPHQADATVADIKQIIYELGELKNYAVVPYSEQQFIESSSHERLTCMHPACGMDTEGMDSLAAEVVELTAKLLESRELANTLDVALQRTIDELAELKENDD